VSDRDGRDGLIGALARMNRTKVFLGVLAVAVLGFFLPGAIGALVLLAVAVALGFLLSATWPVTPPGLRVFRLAVLAAVALIAITKIL
jgi:hypothetical protein